MRVDLRALGSASVASFAIPAHAVRVVAFGCGADGIDPSADQRRDRIESGTVVGEQPAAAETPIT